MKIEPWICPSLLAGDFGAFRDSARAAQAAGADALHMDIMDANFVPNLSMNSDVVKMASKAVTIPMHVHLMMINPTDYLRQYIEAGAHTLLIHVEARGDIPAALRAIRSMGACPGLTLNPETPAETVFEFLPLVDEVLCMTVHPGFGGQKFMPEVLPKIAALHRLRVKGRVGGECAFRLAVDGGVDGKTVRAVAEAGAEVIIAGSAIYRASDMAAEIATMRRIVSGAHNCPVPGGA
ncbi:MAG: ribulose-phosphate 3-epimerase [Kiritimatiellia bacterium]|jgi:ribulose-phosphate 3-epimerase